MYFPWSMVREMNCFIMETGLESRESPYAAAMTDCGLSYSKWSLPDRILPWNMSRSGKINRLV